MERFRWVLIGVAIGLAPGFLGYFDEVNVSHYSNSEPAALRLIEPKAESRVPPQQLERSEALFAENQQLYAEVDRLREKLKDIHDDDDDDDQADRISMLESSFRDLANNHVHYSVTRINKIKSMINLDDDQERDLRNYFHKIDDDQRVWFGKLLEAELAEKPTDDLISFESTVDEGALLESILTNEQYAIYKQLREYEWTEAHESGLHRELSEISRSIFMSENQKRKVLKILAFEDFDSPPNDSDEEVEPPYLRRLKALSRVLEPRQIEALEKNYQLERELQKPSTDFYRDSYFESVSIESSTSSE